jgi:hypothetical protein
LELLKFLSVSSVASCSNFSGDNWYVSLSRLTNFIHATPAGLLRLFGAGKSAWKG